MFIVNYDRDVVVNVDNISAICVENKHIQAVTAQNMRITLGAYATENRTNEVYKSMLDAIFKPMMLSLQNCNMDSNHIKHFKDIGVELLQIKDNSDTVKAQRLDCGVYYMPEE